MAYPSVFLSFLGAHISPHFPDSNIRRIETPSDYLFKPLIMAGGAVISGTMDTSRVEAPVTMKAYFMCAFAAFGGIFFGYDTGWMGG